MIALIATWILTGEATALAWADRALARATPVENACHPGESHTYQDAFDAYKQVATIRSDVDRDGR